MKRKVHNRYIILCAAAAVGFLTGAFYMWSIFNAPLMEAHGWSLQQVSLAYSLYWIFDCFGCLFTGVVLKRMRISTLLLICGIIYGTGWFLAGYATTIPVLYLTLCVMAGGADGFLYNICVTTATLWFPEKRGFANGVCVGCVGTSALFFAPVGNMLIEHFSPSFSLNCIGIAALIVAVVCSYFVTTPEPGWEPVIKDGKSERRANRPKKQSVKPLQEVSLRGALKQPLFWVLLIAYAMATFSGMMTTSHASNIGQSVLNMTAWQGSLMVGVLAAGNFTGCFIYGSLADAIGNHKALIIGMAITVIDMAFIGHVASFPAFMIAIYLIGNGFGAAMTIVPSMCALYFGELNFSLNFSFLYIGYTLACFTGPLVAAFSVDEIGSYGIAFAVAGLMAFASAILIFAIKQWGKKLEAKAF